MCLCMRAVPAVRCYDELTAVSCSACGKDAAGSEGQYRCVIALHARGNARIVTIQKPVSRTGCALGAIQGNERVYVAPCHVSPPRR